jgi:hypothetical protein
MRSLHSLSSIGLLFVACSSESPNVPVDASVDAVNDTTTQDVVTDTTLPPTDAGADVDAATWTPKELSGLVLWLDSEVELTQDADGGDIYVPSWKDQSGTGNHAVAPGVGLPPVLGTGIGGHPSVHFWGARLEVPDSPSLQLGTGPFMLAVVARHRTAADAGLGYGFFLTKQNAASPFEGPGLIGNDAYGHSVIMFQARINDGQVKTPTMGWNANQPILMVVTRDKSGDGGTPLIDLRINGASVATGNGVPYGVDLSAPGRKLIIGDGPTGTQSLAGDISEVILVKGSAIADPWKVEGYLKAKYGL